MGDEQFYDCSYFELFWISYFNAHLLVGLQLFIRVSQKVLD